MKNFYDYNANIFVLTIITKPYKQKIIASAFGTR